MVDKHLYIVTLKFKRNPNHNPRNKKTGACQTTNFCTDCTGEHHCILIRAVSMNMAEIILKLHYPNVHVTRIEQADLIEQ